MTALPKWWEWVEPGPPDESDPGVRIALCVVHPDTGEGVACVCEREGAIGAWFEIDDGELRVECGGFSSAEDAQRACERVYAAVIGALQEGTVG